jgi:hypothetical protein
MSAAQDAVTSVLRRYPGQEEFFGKKAGPKFAVEEEMDTGRVPPGSVKAGLRKPRVEIRVEALDKARRENDLEPIVLDRDTRETWKSLDPKIKKILKKTGEEEFHEIMVGRGLTAAESAAWDAILKGKEEQISAMDHEIASLPAGKGTEKRRMTLIKERETLNASYIAGEFAMLRDGTSLGRAMAIRNRLMKAKTLTEGLLRKIYKELPGMSEENAGALLQAMKTDPAAARRIIQDAIPASNWNKLIEYWKAGLLSAMGTHARNLTGNSLEHIVRMGETATAAGVDVALSKFTGERHRYSGEAWGEAKGSMSAFPQAFINLIKNSWDAIRLQDRPFDVTTRFEHQVGAIRGTKGKIIRLPFRALEVGDNFFKEVGGGAEAGKLAYRMAKGEGKTGVELKKRTLEILRDAADTSKEGGAEFRKLVEQAKLDRTFQTRRHEGLESAIRHGKKRFRAAEFVLPFVQTPGNILRLTWQRSPAGFIKVLNSARKKYKAGEITQGEYADMIARPLLGTAMVSGFIALAESGFLTGTGPTDWDEQQAKRATGWQPEALAIPVKGRTVYIPTAGFEPLSTLMSLASNFVEAKNESEAGEALNRMGGTVASSFVGNKSYLRGAGEFARAWHDPDRYLAAYLANLAGTAIPNIVAKAAKAVDPTWRETRPETKGIAGAGQRISRKLLPVELW